MSTLQALLVALLALLPGAAYTWAYEQEAGQFKSRATDRLLRYVGSSAALMIIALPLLYQGYRELVVTLDLQRGRALPWWVWLLSAAYVIIPAALGRGGGYLMRKRRGSWGWLQLFSGPAPAPRAWDYLFTQPDLTGWIWIYLMEGEPIFGRFDRGSGAGGALRSYAAGYPDEQDLFVADTAQLDVSGAPVLDSTGNPVMTGIGVLVRWDQVAYIEFRKD